MQPASRQRRHRSLRPGASRQW
ncbi:hypothetical protein D7S70_01185 [Ralstonia pickettii]|nr:hypothetical protein [Ralstonia pickettii]MBB0034205.1 hypothetical protein [Ralstonia pickettii]MBB0096877.1 hypothetical protein [Ralstonia pickettii]MBB0106673.1 hypothetical protein [Ralstonia pickettii]MBB0126458.1 hypothetical protein [Ralstonia pickettii]